MRFDTEKILESTYLRIPQSSREVRPVSLEYTVGLDTETLDVSRKSRKHRQETVGNVLDQDT